MTNHCAFTVVIFLSVAQSTASGLPTTGFPLSRFDLSKDPDLVAVLVYGSDWPEFQSRLIPRPLPDTSEDIEYINLDNNDDDVNDDKLQTMPVYKPTFSPDIFRKRGIYDAERLAFFKRSSLNELIRRLMALRGNNYTDGRAYYMRFGAGRK